MLLIECPHCGPREQTEFTCGGEGHIVRPDPATATDAEWGHYLFMRKNHKGLHYERWFHAARSTVTHEIFAIYGIDEPPPAIDANKAGSR